MMKELWDTRYQTDQYVYGRKPNGFFAEELGRITPGKILLPGEGEGRNAVHAALSGWEVDAFDQSSAGHEKAMQLAGEHHVKINYRVSGLEEMMIKTAHYDVVALIYFHAVPELRRRLHSLVQEALRPEGIIILEGFHTSQLGNNSGGPQAEELLFNFQRLRDDFSGLDQLLLEKKRVVLNEGTLHQGPANIIRFLGKKSK
jgi:2-polyprenyl-3-methyl-5-hydroxy-6-metoxy-1,4-benzoquinol methylase